MSNHVENVISLEFQNIFDKVMGVAIRKIIGNIVIAKHRPFPSFIAHL